MSTIDITALMTEGVLARLLPAAKETTLQALQQFQPEAYLQASAFAAAGALLASALLYMVGIWLRRVPKKVSTEAQQARIEKLRGVAMEWLPWLLIFSPTPIGGMLILAAGFFGLRPVVAALAIIGGELLWRASPLL
jgi:membrane protein YqaA with SNARE-associated domain